MASDCCLAPQSQERRCLAGFLVVLKHILFLNTNETPHLDNECSLLSSFTFTVMLIYMQQLKTAEKLLGHFAHKILHRLFSTLFYQLTAYLTHNLLLTSWIFLYEFKILMKSKWLLICYISSNVTSLLFICLLPPLKLGVEDKDGQATGWLDSSWQVVIGVIYHLWNGPRAHHTNHDSARCSNWSMTHKYTHKVTHKHKSDIGKQPGTCKNMPLSSTKNSHLKWMSKIPYAVLLVKYSRVNGENWSTLHLIQVWCAANRWGYIRLHYIAHVVKSWGKQKANKGECLLEV